MKKFLGLGIAILSMSLAACQENGQTQDLVSVTEAQAMNNEGDTQMKTPDEEVVDSKNTPVSVAPVDTTATPVTMPQYEVQNEFADAVQVQQEKEQFKTEVSATATVESQPPEEEYESAGLGATSTAQANQETPEVRKTIKLVAGSDDDED